MKTKLFFEWARLIAKWVGILAALVVIAWLFAGVVRYASNRANERERQRILVVEQMSRNVAIGLPAGEDRLQEDLVYFVNISMVDTFPDRTNNFAVLNGVKIVSNSEYHHSDEPRLFLLSKSLTRGYYKVKRSGTNVLYEPIPGPVRPK